MSPIRMLARWLRARRLRRKRAAMSAYRAMCRGESIFYATHADAIRHAFAADQQPVKLDNGLWLLPASGIDYRIEMDPAVPGHTGDAAGPIPVDRLIARALAAELAFHRALEDRREGIVRKDPAFAWDDEAT